MELNSPQAMTAFGAASLAWQPLLQTLPQQQSPQQQQQPRFVQLLMEGLPSPAPLAPAAGAAAAARADAATAGVHPQQHQAMHPGHAAGTATAAGGAAAPGASTVCGWSLHGKEPWVPQRYPDSHADPVVVIDPLLPLMRKLKRGSKQKGGNDPKRQRTEAAPAAAGGGDSGLGQQQQQRQQAGSDKRQAVRKSKRSAHLGAPGVESATHMNDVGCAVYAIRAMLDRCWARNHAAKLAEQLKAGTGRGVWAFSVVRTLIVWPLPAT